MNIIERLKAIEDMWGLVQSRERDALCTLIADLEAQEVLAERDGPLGLSQIEVFKNDGVLCFDHGMFGHPRYPTCHVAVTRRKEVKDG